MALGESDFQSHTGINWGGAGGYVGTVQYGGMPVVLFYTKPQHNVLKSKEKGSPIYDDVVYVKIHPPGERLNIIDRPAREEDKQRYVQQWMQFSQNRRQIPEGTPINLLYPEKPSIAKMLQANGVYTIEQCAALSGPAIDNIGMGAQGYVNDSQRFLEQAAKGSNTVALRTQKEEHDRDVKVLKQQIEMLKAEVSRLTTVQSGPSMEQMQAVMASIAQRPGMPPTVPGLSGGVAPQFDAQTAQINATSETHRIAEAKRKPGRPKKVA